MDQAQRLFLRDLGLILGGPALVLVGLLAWLRPWNFWSGTVVTSPHETQEAHARAAGIRDTTWHGLHLSVSDEYVILSQDSVVEIVEQYPPVYGNGNWGSHVAFLPLTTAARQRFQERAANCALAPGRCWEEQSGGHQLRCQQAAGAPVPELWWTPLTICEVSDLGLWVALNAREARRPELWEVVSRTLREAQRLELQVPSGLEA